MELEYLGNKIKQYRLKNRLTQKDLTVRLNVTFKAVSKWETHRCYPDINLLSDIASILDVRISELIGEESADLSILKLLRKKDSELKRTWYHMVCFTAYISIIGLAYFFTGLGLDISVSIFLSLILSIITKLFCNKLIYDDCLEFYGGGDNE